MSEQNQQAAAQKGTEVREAGDLYSLLNRELRIQEAGTSQVIENAVQRLAKEVLEDTKLVSDDVLRTIDSVIAQIDKKLSDQLNLVIHHADFQKLEGSWRGLHYLVNNTETDEFLKIRVLNVSKTELRRTFQKFEGVAWDQSPLFKKLYEEEFGLFGGQPYGCLVGDYEFGHREPDMTVLKGIAKIAAAAHAPFISAPHPDLFQMQSWQELSNPRDLTKIFQQPEYASWRSFRAEGDSQYVGLAMPRFLSRLPYGPTTNPSDGFDFVEEAEGGDHSKYTWANSAYAMAVNITTSFKMYGWCTRIRGVESGGAVAGLPSHTFKTDDGGVDMKCPTEIAITDRREAELAKNGLMPLLHRKNSDFAAFIGAQSLHQPAVYDTDEATANANLGARLPYMFATCRFAHYLKAIVRDKVGGFATANQMQEFLQRWILNYVDGDPEGSSDVVKAQRPLAGAEVRVVENKANPGYFNATFLLKPHYQLEGLNISLRLVSQLKNPSGG